MKKTNRFSAAAVVSLLLKAAIAVCASVGVYLSGINSHGFMGGKTLLLYFTIQSNLWIAVTCLCGLIFLLCGLQLRTWMYVVKLMFTVAITLTGFVFCVMLAPLLGVRAYSVPNVLTHVAVPLLSIADFLLYDGAFPYKARQCLFVAVPPFYYVCFAAIGYVQGWNFGGGINYPYFFLNWGSPAGAFGFCKGLPFMGVVWWLVVLVVFLTVVGLGFIKLGAKLHRRRA